MDKSAGLRRSHRRIEDPGDIRGRTRAPRLHLRRHQQKRVLHPEARCSRRTAPGRVSLGVTAEVSLDCGVEDDLARHLQVSCPVPGAPVLHGSMAPQDLVSAPVITASADEYTLQVQTRPGAMPGTMWWRGLITAGSNRAPTSFESIRWSLGPCTPPTSPSALQRPPPGSSRPRPCQRTSATRRVHALTRPRDSPRSPAPAPAGGAPSPGTPPGSGATASSARMSSAPRRSACPRRAGSRSSAGAPPRPRRT